MTSFEASVPEDEDNPCIVCGSPFVFVTLRYEDNEVGLCAECDDKATQEYVHRHMVAQTN